MTRDSDWELIERTRAGDSAAFDALWERHRPAVTALCRRSLTGPGRDPAIDEQDLAVEIFIRALHHLDRYEDRSAQGTAFGAWLREVARRVCLDAAARDRRRGRWGAGPVEPAFWEGYRDARPGASELAERREVLRVAAREINRLPPPYRDAFKLHLEERSHGEIAQALGISEAGAAKRVQRARRLLQPRLSAVLGQPETPARTARLASVEQALREIVGDYRIVPLALESGAEVQLLLRVDRELARAEPQIRARLARIESRTPDAPAVWQQRLRLADTCYHAGRWEEAREQYRAVLDRNPACFAAALRLGTMLGREQQPETATRVFSAALALAPPPGTASLLSGHLFLQQDRWAQAAAAFRQAIELAPEEKAAYYGLNAALEARSGWEEQLENLAALRARYPDEVFAYTAAYTPCARLFRFEEARLLLERAVELDPHSVPAIRHLFQVRMNLRLVDEETLGLAQRMVRLAPEYAASWNELAWIYDELGREAESLAVLREFLAEHPHSAEALAALAWRCHYMGRLTEAAGYAREAYELAPEYGHYCWTVLNMYKGDHPAVLEADALALGAEITARLPVDDQLLCKLADFYRSWRRETEAVDFARRAVELNPNSAEVQADAARTYRACGRLPEASAASARVLALPGGRTAGWVYLHAEDLRALGDARAEACFAEAAALADVSADDMDRVFVYQSLGRREEAISLCRAALASPGCTSHRRRGARRFLRELEAESATEAERGIQPVRSAGR